MIDKARMWFCEEAMYNKGSIISNCMGSMVQWQSAQSAKLRTCESTIEWELEQMRGAHNDHMRSTICTITNRSIYEACGIDVFWQPITLHQEHPMVKHSDDMCSLLWDLSFAIAKEQTMRQLPLTHGYPRRFTLITSNIARDAKLFLHEFKEDSSIYRLIKRHVGDWVDQRRARSVFERPTNLQIKAYLKQVNYTMTPWLRVDFLVARS